MGGASYGGMGGNGVLLGGVASCSNEPLTGGALYGVSPIEPSMGRGINQNADGTQVAMNVFGGGNIKIQAKLFFNQGIISADGQNAPGGVGVLSFIELK